MEKTEGLLRQDVRAMLQIWNEYDSNIRRIWDEIHVFLRQTRRTRYLSP